MADPKTRAERILRLLDVIESPDADWKHTSCGLDALEFILGREILTDEELKEVRIKYEEELNREKSREEADKGKGEG